MAKIKIYSELRSGKVNFEGSRISNKDIGSLEVTAHPTIANRVVIKSLRRFKRGSTTEYRVFFGRLNINRIQNKAGQDLTAAPLFYDRTQVIAYLDEQFRKPVVQEYFEYNPTTDRLEARKDIEVQKNGFYLGAKHKMASGNSNIYFEDLDNKANAYPIFGEVLDQSLAANQIAGAGVTKPKSRIFQDFQSIPLGGTPVDDTAIGYDGSNFFPFNISGVGITTRVAETVAATQQLKYEIIINNISVYVQYLEHNGLAVNEDITWYFEQPLDIENGTTLRATIYKVSTVDNQEQNDGILLVCQGTETPVRYQTNVLNRFFTDEDIAFKSDVASLLNGSIYKGTYNADTDTPALPTGTDVLGDFYRVSASGSVSGSVYNTGDIRVYNGTSYDLIAEQNATQSDIKNSALRIYDIYVKAGYAGAVQDGSVLYPYPSIETAIATANHGDSIYLEGVFEISGEIVLPQTKSLFFYGSDDATISFTTYSDGNGSLLYFNGLDNTKEFKFRNIRFYNAGGYGLYLKKTSKVTIQDCTFKNNGWNGTALNTIASTAITTLLGYDSSAADLQTFASGSNVSSGGAVRLEEATQLLLTGNTATNNFRGIRLQDCGINGGGVVSRNQVMQNIESGIYLAAGTLNGCHNITTTMNVSAYNANNGLLAIGGINNKFSQNEVNGNWNAGFCAWGSANATLRDCGLYDNNRSALNGIGNTGDAKASIQINEASSYLSGSIALDPNFRFIAEILDTQVHYTGLGSNTEKIGFLITNEVGLLPADDKNIIRVDDVGFIGQDYAIDFSEVNLNNLYVSLGDNSFKSIGEKGVKTPLAGDYYELPFSNHTTKLNYVDVSVDLTGNVLIKEGPTGERLNPYKVNDLHAVAFGTEIKVLLKDSDKIQFVVPVAGCSINGTFVNPVLNQAIVQLNGIFTNTVGFASNPDTFVNGFTLSGNDLTITLNDSTSYTVDVTSLGVDTNNFVASGTLTGSDLVLTMDDSTTVTVDASALALDENDVVTSGTLTGSDLVLTLSTGSTVTIDVTSLGVDTNLYVESGVLSGTDLILTMSDASTITVDATGLAVDNDTTISGGIVNGTDIELSVSDGSTITIDASALDTGTSTQVVSGVVTGSDLVLTMGDSTTVTIDATNLISGASLSATNDRWYISYGTNANQEVGVTTMTSAVNLQGPYYFGQSLVRGSEFKFNMNSGNQLRLGIWDGAEVATAYNGSPAMSDASNWGTVFSYANGSQKFTDSSNVDISTYHASGYTVTNGNAMSIKFLDSGHLELWDVTANVKVGQTTISLSVTEFNLQFGGFNNSAFPNGIISTQDWTIVHDLDGDEAGILNGIQDHTVIKSNISIEIGEKIMFMLDETGTGDFFGTGYTAAATGVGTAEEQLNNTFIYQTNEAIVFDSSAGVSDWNANTNAPNYFLAASLNQYRDGGAGTIQGMFSLRFTDNGQLTIYDEDSGVKIATAKQNPTVGSAVSLYFGVKGNRAYYSIPVISKQTIGQGSQPDINFAPVVADQTVSVQEADVLNFQIISSDNVINQFVELDAPSWMFMNQTTGILSGTAPAYVGSAADTIVVNCKAGNAIGGTIDFTITVTVTSYASTNTKSLKFPSSSNAYLNGNHALVPSLQRTGNGTGSSDAWSISIWVKPSTITNSQTIFYYGGDDLANEGRIDITQFSGGNILFRYGNNANNLNYIGVGNFTTGAWNHVLITYSGANTLIASGGATAFSMFINGANGTSQLQQTGGGYSGNIPADKFRIGRLLGTTTSQYLSDGIINQVAIFNTDESANISTIYNSGATQDLSQLTSAPVHYYEIETSVTTIPDIIGSADLTGFNFAAADLVSDTP